MNSKRHRSADIPVRSAAFGHRADRNVRAPLVTGFPLCTAIDDIARRRRRILATDYTDCTDRENPCNPWLTSVGTLPLCTAIVEIARSLRRNVAVSRLPIAPFLAIRICFGFRASDFGFPAPPRCALRVSAVKWAARKESPPTKELRASPADFGWRISGSAGLRSSRLCGSFALAGPSRAWRTSCHHPKNSSWDHGLRG